MFFANHSLHDLVDHVCHFLHRQIIAGREAWITGRRTFREANGTIEEISDSLFETWVLPFEVTGLLFIIAAAGTIALAQFRSKEREQEEAE